MELYISNKSQTYSAKGIYNPESKSFIVCKGSTVSEDIAYTPTFRGAKTIEKLRKSYVQNNIVQENVEFRSSSSAANFVTGRSSNGMIMWKTKEGIPLKTVLQR